MNALLSPTDPTPRTEPLDVALATGESVSAVLDFYSERVRCDHPQATDGVALGDALREEAEAHGSGRVVVLASDALEAEREVLGDAAAVARVEAILEHKRGLPAPPLAAETHRATVADADGIAALIAETFAQYPTPSGDPDYIAEAIAAGVPFRTVAEDGVVVACASADLVRDARTAELTDCATRPSHRGQGLMRALLADLMGDLSALGYPTAFTLARAVEPGINVAFQRLGFTMRGRMVRSCRIGGGLEDMNVWSRALPA